MSNRCGHCGGETVLLREWRQDLRHCKLCGRTRSNPTDISVKEWYEQVGLGRTDELSPLLSLRVGPRGRMHWMEPRALELMRRRGELAPPGTPEEIPSFLDRYFHYMRIPDVFRAALQGFVDVAPSVTKEHAERFSEPEMLVLTLMAGDGLRERTREFGWDHVVAACSLLSLTSYATALWPLGRVAANEVEGVMVPEDVRAAAEAALSHLRANILPGLDYWTLLRASTMTDDEATLLRPAGPGDEPPGQLLRREEPK